MQPEFNTKTTTTTGSPVSAIVNAPGGWLRVAVVALAALGLIFPIINPAGSGAGLHLWRMAGWTILGPLLAGLALVAPAISRTSRFGQALDIVSVLFFAAVSVLVVIGLSEANARAARIVGGGSSNQFDNMFASSLGSGAYAWFAAAVVALLAVFARRRARS